MLANKTVQVEQNIDALLGEIKNVIMALKSGKTPAEVALGELLRLQTIVLQGQGSVTDLKESLPAAIRTILLGAEELALTLFDVAQPL